MSQQLEYPDVDQAIEQSTQKLKHDLACGGVLIMLRDSGTGRWSCTLPGPGHPVVSADSYVKLVEFLTLIGVG